jgi:hypothetical protein
MTQPHEDLLFDSRLLLLYPPTLLKTITEKSLVLVVVVDYYLDIVNSKNCSCSQNRRARVSKTWSLDFFLLGLWTKSNIALTFSVQHLNAIRSTANRGCSGIKPLPALQHMQLSSCKG